MANTYQALFYSRYSGNSDEYQRDSLHLNGIYIVLEETESKTDK